MKIDFKDAKYQVPSGPGPVDLTEYETQLVGGADGIDTTDYKTKDTVYVAGISGDNYADLEPANYEGIGTKARIASGQGDDTLYLDGYRDFTMIGGAGDDYLETYSGTNGHVDAGEGDDEVYSAAKQVKLGDGHDYFDANYGGNQGVNAWGEGGNDKLNGYDADDLLMGGDGKDKIKGYGGNDTINGGVGNDKITCGGGDDYVKPGRGNDKIKLGDGKDTLDLSRGKDKVKDFKVKDDSVVIDEDAFGQKLEFVDKKKGCYITDGDDVKTFFKGVSSDLLATVVDLT